MNACWICGKKCRGNFCSDVCRTDYRQTEPCRICGKRTRKKIGICKACMEKRKKKAGRKLFPKLARIPVIAMFFVIILIGAGSSTHLKNLKTGSMPCFQNDSWIITESKPFASLEVGDVVCYKPDIHTMLKYREHSGLARYYAQFGTKNYLCHRLVYFDGVKGVAKGDNNLFADPFFVTSGNYYGTVENERC